MTERATLLGLSESLVSIITEPSAKVQDNGRPAILLLNAGVVHRVGPNRLYVRVARRLASHGFLCVRFDHAGVGDSPPPNNDMPYAERWINETQEVMNWLTKHYGARQFCLMGLCSGAMTSFNTACCDSRVVGIVLLNVQGLGGSLDWFWYIGNRLDPREYIRKFYAFWRIQKNLKGNAPSSRVARGVCDRFKNVVKQSAKSASLVSQIASDLEKLIDRNVHLLWASSEMDASREYLRIITDGVHRGRKYDEYIDYATIPATNHTFDTIPAQERVLSTIEEWVKRCWPESGGAQGYAKNKDVLKWDKRGNAGCHR